MARDQLDPGAIDALINELETKMARLRSIYEQYFMGIERMPPSTLRKDVVRLIHNLENAYIRNTATKFKVRSLVQRFNSYKAYWNRVERQIEEGTYKRDINRAQRNTKRRERRDDRSERNDDGIVDIDMDDIEALGDLQAEMENMLSSGEFDRRTSEPPAPGSELSAEERERRKAQKLAEIRAQLAGGGDVKTSNPQPTPPAASTPATRGAPVSTGARAQRASLSDIKAKMAQRGAAPASSSAGSGNNDEARRVYNQLIEAKQRCNESTKGLTYEAVSKSMSKQREQLRNKRGASDVEFKVVIKDGRAFLKPETK